MSQFLCECVRLGLARCHQGCMSTLVHYTPDSIIPPLPVPLNATEGSPYSNPVVDGSIMQLSSVPEAPHSWLNAFRDMPWDANAIAEHQSTQTAGFQPHGVTTYITPPTVPIIMHQNEELASGIGSSPAVVDTPTEGPQAHQAKSNPATSRCEWEDCTYQGTFACTADLKRHVNIEHIEPQSHKYCIVHPSRPSPVVSRCGWKGCNYHGTFARTQNLKRHLDTKHMVSQSHKCHVVGCDKTCNRSDNLKAHMKHKHASEK